MVNSNGEYVMLTDAEFFEKYRRLLWDWDLATRNVGWMKDMCADPNYLKIIELGPRVIPILLDDLKWSKRFWYKALEELTGCNPVPKEHEGNLEYMRQDWLEFGDKYHWSDRGIY